MPEDAATPLSAREAAPQAMAQFAMPWGASNATWAVVLLTVAAAILRLSFLDSKSLWVDEGMTACMEVWPLSHLVWFVLHREMNMFLYYLLVHGWVWQAGTSEFMLRLPSVLFDTATIPLIYALGTELGNRRAGLIAALMLTLNASSIKYAQTARSYAMLVALATLAAVFFVRSCKNPSRGNLAGYIISGSCAVYVHFFAIFILPAQWLFLLWLRFDWKVVSRLTVCIVAIGILSLAAFFFGISGDQGHLAWVPAISFGSIADLFVFFSGGFDDRATLLSLALTAAYLTGIAVAFVQRRNADRLALDFLLVSILVPIALVIGISFFRSIFVDRYLLAGLPLWVLLSAMGYARLRPGAAIATLLAVTTLSGAAVFTYYRAPSIQDWRGATDFIATHSKPGDAWIIYPDSCGCLFSYYGARYQHPEAFPVPFGRLEGARNVNELVRQLSGINKNGYGRRRVWLTFPLADPLDMAALDAAFASSRITEESGLSGIGLVLVEPSH